MATVYPLDPTGISPTNKIVDEIKVVTPPTKITDANFIVPNITPFFKEGFSIRLGTRVLVEGVDYQLVFRHIAASTHFTREIFGGIMFINKQFTGTVRLTYQVLGGEFQNANPDAITEFSKAIGAVRWITFDQILGVPSSFPPAYHEHDLESDLIDMGDVVDAIEKLTLAIVNKTSSAESFAIQRHIDSPAAHTKAAVGLGNVANYPPGTVDDVKQGRTGKYVTTDLLKIWFNTLTMNDFNINLDDFYNRAAIDAKVKSLQDALNLRVTKSVMDAAIAAAVKPVSDRINNFRIDPNSKEFRDAMNSLINSSLSTINSSISTLQGTVNSHTQSIRDILAKIASNDTTYRGLFLPKTEFNTYKTANDRAVQGLQTGLNTANGKIATVEGNLANLTNTINTVNNRINLIGTRVLWCIVNIKLVSYFDDKDRQYFDGIYTEYVTDFPERVDLATVVKQIGRYNTNVVEVIFPRDMSSMLRVIVAGGKIDGREFAGNKLSLYGFQFPTHPGGNSSHASVWVAVHIYRNV